MKFTLDTARGILIHAYQAGEVILKAPSDDPANPYQKLSYRSSIILYDTETVEEWPVNQLSELESHHFETVWQARPDIVLLGSGQTLRFPSMEIRQLFADRGIGFEIMDTPAACRTYNVLAAEGRNVMALLIID